jgi:hypothetical protein
MVSLEGPTKAIEIIPPDSLFFGTVFEAANGFVDNLEKDINFRITDPLNPLVDEEARPDWDEIIAGFRGSLLSGDLALAERLKSEYLCQVSLVNNGERFAITGEAHLILQRCHQASRGVIFYVRTHELEFYKRK